ncbi:hypothetical protein ACLB2K_065558 [Fragaria x ananassa]
MSKLGLLQTSIRSTLAARTSLSQTHRLLPFLLFDPTRRFSTAAEQPPQNSAPGQPPSLDATVDQIVRNPNTGAAVYGKLVGITRNTLRTDVVNLLEGCNLTLEDVKVHYNGPFIPTGMLVQFPPGREFENAVRVLRGRGLAQVFRLQRLDRHLWDDIPHYDGKTVLIEGIPRTALQEDVERFLSGTPYEASSIKIFMKQGSIRMATVQFPSQIQAKNAYITKNKGFIQNDKVLMRVLQ